MCLAFAQTVVKALNLALSVIKRHMLLVHKSGPQKQKNEAENISLRLKIRYLFWTNSLNKTKNEKIYIIGRRNLVVKKEKTKRNFFRFA